MGKQDEFDDLESTQQTLAGSSGTTTPGMVEEKLSDPEQLETISNQPIPPDGGLNAWLCVLGAFCCQVCSFGFITACGIFQTHYELELLRGHSSSSIAWITTIQVSLMYVLGGGVGVAVDAFGPRIILITCSVVSVFGICMLSLSTQYWQVLLSQGVVYGMGAAGLFLPGMVTTGQWFTTKRGLALGIVASGSSVGGVVYPFMITGLIEKQGFPAAVRWTALMLGILLTIACVCITAPFPPKGLAGKKSSGAKAFKSLSWIGYTLGCFFIVWGLFAPFNYLPLMALKAGISPDLARYSISITNAASIPGRIIPAFLSDRFGQFNTMSVVAIASGVSLLAFWLPVEIYPNHAGILAFGAFYGFTSGGFVSLLTPCIVALSNGKVEELGARMGAFMVVLAVAALTGLPIQGAILDKNPESFVGSIVFAGVVMTFGGLIILGVRVRRGGMSLRVKV